MGKEPHAQRAAGRSLNHQARQAEQPKTTEQELATLRKASEKTSTSQKYGCQDAKDEQPKKNNSVARQRQKDCWNRAEVGQERKGKAPHVHDPRQSKSREVGYIRQRRAIVGQGAEQRIGPQPRKCKSTHKKLHMTPQEGEGADTRYLSMWR